MSREHLYTLVSGNVPDEKYREILLSYYTRFYSFANYVDERFYFEDQNIPLITRIIKPAREMIATYANEVAALMESHSGVYYGQSHDYLYYTFKHSNFPKLEECMVIC